MTHSFRSEVKEVVQAQEERLVPNPPQEATW